MTPTQIADSLLRALRQAAALLVFRRASSRSVTLPTAEYDYGVNWATSTDGTLTRWTSS